MAVESAVRLTPALFEKFSQFSTLSRGKFSNDPRHADLSDDALEAHLINDSLES
jgi:hypothetical protein